MKKTVKVFVLLISLFLSCEKPSNGLVIPKPDTDPTTPSGGDNSGGGDNGGSDSGNTETPPERQNLQGTFVVGYATYWDSAIPDPTLLTHINYAFAHIKSDYESLDIKEPNRLKQIVYYYYKTYGRCIFTEFLKQIVISSALGHTFANT